MNEKAKIFIPPSKPKRNMISGRDDFKPFDPGIKDLKKFEVKERKVNLKMLESIHKKIGQDLQIDQIEESVKKNREWVLKNKLYIPLPLMVSFDFHIPRTSKEWVEKMLEISLKKKIRRLVIGGDFFDESWWSFWTSTGPEITWDDEIKAATQMMDSLLKFYEKIYIFLGNHDLRIWNQLGKRFEAVNLFKAIISNHALIGDRIFISNIEYAYTENVTCPSCSNWKNDKEKITFPCKHNWLICHPKNYSIRGTTVPVDIAEIQTISTIGGHGHHLGAAKTKSDKFWGIDGGGMFDESSMTYNGEVRKSKHPQWNNGFVTLNEEGKFRIYGKGLDED